VKFSGFTLSIKGRGEWGVQMSEKKAMRFGGSPVAHPALTGSTTAHLPARLLLALSLFALSMQTGCLFHKNRGAGIAALPAPVRIAFLPFIVPEENAELRWIALAAPVMMTEVSAGARDLEPAPFWESMPAAIQIMGASRRITPEIADFIASRLTARWAGAGEITAGEDDIILRVDFVPSGSSSVPFRYEARTSLPALDGNFAEAFEQFLRYLIMPRLERENIEMPDERMFREIAATLDVEYGWFVPAKPGAAQNIVERLAASDLKLARLLFNPALYPVLAK
jgi:hypothetical protein